MCGIVGVLGKGPVAELLVDALKRLEYRGYNSPALPQSGSSGIERRRAEGKLRNLEALLERRAAARRHRDRPYALGDAWQAERSQCPSAHDR